MAKKSTYGTISKWFKWSSLIILLVPIAELILVAINLAQKNSTNPDWYDTGILVLTIISLASAVIWVILNIIMFFAAGTVRNDGPSPLGIRLGLLIAMVLVLAPIILGLIAYFLDKNSGTELGNWAYWVGTLVPIAGYTIGAIMGSKLQHNLN